MKKVLYLSVLILFVFGGCKKKPAPIVPIVPEPTITMNYVQFTINGKGYNNKKMKFSKAKNTITRYEYSETSAGVIGAFLDIQSGDTVVQLRFDEKTLGNKPFFSGAVFFVFTDINALHPLTATSTDGAYNVISFTPTHLETNTTSGTVKGKFILSATFSGTLTDDASTDTYTITDGVVVFDGE